MVIRGSQINRSYFFGIDTKFGYGNVTYYSYFGEFNRSWKGASYIEAAVMTTMFVLSVIGNTFILGITLKSKTSRTITNYFVCNLAIGDILFVTSAPFVAYVRITETWRLGDGMCHVLNYGMFVCGVAIIWTMAVISVDRYICIMKGSARSLKTVHVVLICFVTWIVSASSFLPIALFFHIKDIELEHEIISFCTLLWPQTHINYSVMFMCMLVILGFVIPVAIITFNYYKIFRKFWISKRAVGILPRGQSRNQKLQLRNKDLKIVKTLVLLVVVFIIMWLPLFMVLTLLYYDLAIEKNSLPSYGLTWSLMVAYINPCVNPFLYGCINMEISPKLCFCCGKDKNSSEGMLASNTHLNDNNNSTRI